MTSRNSRQPRGAFGNMTIEEPRPLHLQLVPQSQSHHALNPTEKRIAEEFARQTFSTEAQKEKTKFVVSSIAEMREHTSFTFQDTLVSIVEKQREVHGQDIEGYVVEFNRANSQAMGNDMLAAARTGADNINAVNFKSLDLPPLHPPPPPPPPSLLKRIFG